MLSPVRSSFKPGWQKANKDLPEDHKIVLRVGINLGDVIVEGGDLYGDGVNVPARLQSLAMPEDICISGSVYDQVKRKLDFVYDEIGPQTMKNIAEPVPVYRVWAPSSRQEYYGSAEKALPLPTKPSIAVLPFTNMSNDPEQETFVDGLTEDLITDLSRTAGLFVIARNSTFAYKGRSLDARRIAHDLGVRYLLEGSARRAAGRVRINVQLIDAIRGDHLWAERFDRSLEDIFAVQDEVTGKIVEALIGRLTVQPARNKPANLEAYELRARARTLGLQTSLGGTRGDSPVGARDCARPGICRGAPLAGAEPVVSLGILGRADAIQAGQRPSAVAHRAAALDPNDAGNRWVLSIILGHERRWAESDAEFEATLKLDPNYADAWAMRSEYFLITLAGRPADAVEHVYKALRLNPHPPGWYYWMLGQAQYALHDYKSAVQTSLRPETHRTRHRAAFWRRAWRNSDVWRRRTGRQRCS